MWKKEYDYLPKRIIWRKKYIKKRRDYSIKYQAKMRRIVLEHYGGKKPICNCCKIDIYEALTIDHIFGLSKKEKLDRYNSSGSRRGTTGLAFYRKIMKNNFPKKYQILCFNCNWLKAKHYGLYLKLKRKSR